MNSLYAIGNTHFDPVWEWTLDEAMVSIRSTFRSALDRMKEYPEFIYSFSCPPVFEWIKEVDIEMFAEIQQAVKRKQWDLAEGWWLQSDCNALSGESLVRQALYGQRYLKENFNVFSECMFNSDSFGHSAMMPQILSKSGIKYYVFCRPEDSEKDLPAQIFKWQSKDGSSVLAYKIISGWKPDVKESVDKLKKLLDTSLTDLMLVYGVTNHGGAPTKKNIEYLLNEKELKIKFSFVEDYFKAQNEDNLNVVKDELQVKFFGVYANNPKIKRLNKQTEIALLNAEKSAVLALHFNKEYPQKILNESWKDTLFNQFHDIIGGACIQKAYFHATNIYGRALSNAFEVTHKSLQYISKKIDTKSKFWNLVIFNLNDNLYQGNIEAEVQWAWEFDFYKGGIKLTDDSGNSYICQIIKELSVIDGFRTRFTFDAVIPGLGYKTFMVEKLEEKYQKNITDNFILKNNNYEIKVNKNNGKVLIKNLKNNKLIKNLFSPYILDDEGDTWAFNVKGYGDINKNCRFVSANVLEHGEIKSVLKIIMKFNESDIERYFTIYNNSNYIDCKFKVNWKEKHKVLKFNVNSTGNQVLNIGIPYGSIDRSLENREMPVNEFIQTKEYAILCDGIFAYNTRDNNIGLTVLRSAVAGDFRLTPLKENADYDYISNDINEGNLRYIPKNRKMKIANECAAFFNPPIIIIEACHKGDYKGDEQFLSIDSYSVKLEVVKKAEDNNNIILRLYEYLGKAQTVKINSLLFKSISLNFKPYEIKTISVSKKDFKEINMIENNCNEGEK